jgi:hypothetical protein
VRSAKPGVRIDDAGGVFHIESWELDGVREAGYAGRA